MKWTSQLELRTGIIFAIVLPGLFVFSHPIDALLPWRFVSSFAAIMGMWITVFSLADFRSVWRDGSPWYGIVPGILLTLLLSTIIYLTIGYLDKSGLLLAQLRGDRLYSPNAWFFLVVRLWIFCGFIILIKYVFDVIHEKRRKEKELEILRTEGLLILNESLKQQISPHFLFNSLNTLKALVKQNSDVSLIFIDELASVYRYMLTHYGKNEVTVKEEIDFLRSYLSLLRIRFGDALKTDIDIPEAIYNEGIPPNTFQILIENAVKHNVLTTRKPLRIEINAREKYLEVSNNFQPKIAEGPSSHVGLSNINNRYTILKGREIVVDWDESFFRVKLPIY